MGERELPAGNVTVLFSDIEGSTRLIEELGESAYISALAEHRRLLRAAFAAHRGVEVDTQGDAFLYAFADPREAMKAAVAGQAALASGEVKGRMGLHTGELQLAGEGYAGRELHRAARIAASGHGGQIVLSAATRALVEDDLTELGEHRLKDFDEPGPLFQVGSQRFPPLKTISNTKGYMPPPLERAQRARIVTVLDTDDAAVAAARSEGRALTQDEAVAYALEDHDRAVTCGPSQPREVDGTG